MIEAEAEANHLRPSRGRSQNLDVEAETEVNFKRSRPGPDLKSSNRTLYLTVKIM